MAQYEPKKYQRVNYDKISAASTPVDSNEEDYTIFNRVMYIGAAAMPASASKSKTEILKNIAILNSAQSGVAIEVSISVPSNSEGFVM